MPTGVRDRAIVDAGPYLGRVAFGGLLAADYEVYVADLVRDGSDRATLDVSVGLARDDVRRIGALKQGDDIEDGVITDLRESGFRVNYQQVLFEDKALQLRGRVDGFLSVPGDPLLDVEIPFDVKSVNPSWFDTLTSFD